jgi:hypothetical protein
MDGERSVMRSSCAYCMWADGVDLLVRSGINVTCTVVLLWLVNAVDGRVLRTDSVTADSRRCRES